MKTKTIQALERAHLALEGLSVGDAFGQFYEYDSLVKRIPELPPEIQQRRISEKTIWSWTDDTNMASSIYAILQKYGEINQDELALDFARRVAEKRGYGSSAWDILSKIQQGILWYNYTPTVFNGQGSFGNGAAMRSAPIGAYFADDLEKVVEQAQRSALITHTHADGIAGAIAVAVSTAIAHQQRQNGKRPSCAEFIGLLLQYLPAGKVRDMIKEVNKLPVQTTAVEAARILGSGYEISASDTVPFAIWCAGQWLDNYQEALWQTLSGLGDTDTTCAIVGGIVALYTGLNGIPSLWLQRREPLPSWIID